MYYSFDNLEEYTNLVKSCEIVLNLLEQTQKLNVPYNSNIPKIIEQLQKDLNHFENVKYDISRKFEEMFDKFENI